MHILLQILLLAAGFVCLVKGADMPQEKAITITIAAVNGAIHGIMICVLTAAISA